MKNLFSPIQLALGVVAVFTATTGLTVADTFTGNPAMGNGEANTTVVVPLELSQTALIMNFGSLTAGSDGGTIDSNTQTTTGTVISLTDPQNAYWSLKGAPNVSFNITIDTETIDIQRDGGTELMQVSLIRYLDNPDPKLGPEGNATFQVGGTLNVGANQTPGYYSGEYQITASYE